MATLVAAAEQQQQQQKLQHHAAHHGHHQNVLQVAPRVNLNPHMIQHHPPPLRMVQISNSNLTNGPTTMVTNVALPTAPTPLRHALPQSPLGRPLPQLPRSPLKQG